tara:strand:- start:13053 stop:13739 length:687 start_codon:yes stop_codon:yes gene_type:complete
MVVALLIENGGNIKEIKIKNQEEKDFYKLTGLKKDKDFGLRTNWKLKLNKEYNIHLYAKNNGRAGSENKYEFPPPVESDLYFGKCLLVNKLENKLVDLTPNEWEDIYNYLFGGFDELDESESEDEEDDDVELTKEGYEKDGFIVDENDDDDDEEEDEEEDLESEEFIDEEEEEEEELDFEDDEEEEQEKVLKKSSKKKEKVKKKVQESIEKEEYMDYDEELEEEDYLE